MRDNNCVEFTSSIHYYFFFFLPNWKIRISLITLRVLYFSGYLLPNFYFLLSPPPLKISNGITETPPLDIVLACQEADKSASETGNQNCPDISDTHRNWVEFTMQTDRQL